MGYKKLELCYRREAEKIRYKENREGGGRKFQKKDILQEVETHGMLCTSEPIEREFRKHEYLVFN